MKNYLILIGDICFVFYGTNLNPVCNYSFFFFPKIRHCEASFCRHSRAELVSGPESTAKKNPKKHLIQLFDPDTHLMAPHRNSF